MCLGNTWGSNYPVKNNVINRFVNEVLQLGTRNCVFR